VGEWKMKYNGTAPGDEIPASLPVKMSVGSFVVAMFGMGLATNARDMWTSGKKLAFGAGIGLFCQFLIMPCVAMVAIAAGVFSNDEALIIMLMGACPGGGASNIFVYYLQLNLDLSVLMTNVSAIFSFGLTPAWLGVIPFLLGDYEYQIPFGEIASGVGQLVGPLILGMLVNHFWRKKSEIGQYFLIAFLP